MERQAVESSHEFANVQTPVRVQIIEHPVELFLVGELRGDMGEVSGEIDAGARHAQVPHDFPGRDDERSDQSAAAVANVFVLAFFRFAWLDQDGGVFSLQDLHAGFFIAADDEFAELIKGGSLDVELANVLRLGVEIGIVAVEPIDAAVRLEIGGLEDTLDGGARHGIMAVAIDEFACQIVEAPLTGLAIMVGGFAGGQVDDFELFSGGKSSGVDRSEERLASQRGAGRESDFARG